MIKRSFRTFAIKEDLASVFTKFQNGMDVYYVPTYSDEGAVEVDDITTIKGFGLNRYARKANNQFLVFYKGKKCLWRNYQCQGSAGIITRHSSLGDQNEEYIVIELGGIDEDGNLLPTIISTMHYDIKSSKTLYDEIKKIIRRCSENTINGFYICPFAYEQKTKLRFCTIDIKSPKEYDLIVH